MNSIDTTGRVYFPTPDSNPIQGARLYTKENGLFVEFCFSAYPPIEKCEVILGEFNSIGQVTCLFNRYNGGTIGSAESLCRYKITYLFIGHEFHTRKDIIFHSASFSIDSLFDWFNIRTISYLLKPNPRIDIGPFKRINFKLNNYSDTSFDFGYSLNFSGQNTILSEKTTFNLKTENPLDFWDFYKTLIDLRKFFMLFTNAKIDIDQIIYINHDLKHIFGNDIPDRTKSIKLLHKISDIHPTSSSDFLNLEYSEIKDYFPSILSNWYSICQDNIVFDYLLEKSYNKDLSTKTYFLNMCFAIEIYHKTKIKLSKDKMTEFNRIKNYLLKIVRDKDALNWIRNKFSLGYNPSFKDRLVFYKKEIDEIIRTDSSKMINKIVLTRNSLVHFSSSKKKIIKDSIEFYFIALIIETVLKCLILNDLSLPKEKIDILKKKSIKYIKDLMDINK